MIKVDIPELEKMSDLLFLTASDTDEALNSLRRILAEMQEDLELQTYIQSVAALEAISFSIDSLNRANDTIQSLKGIILGAVSEYRENEEKNVNALARMSCWLESISQGMSAAVSSGEIVSAEIAPEMINQSKVQELVAGSMQEMQIANIAAISKALEEEYRVKNVEDMDESQD